MNSKEGQALKAWIYQKTEQLIQQRHQISICLVLSYCGIEGNKKQICLQMKPLLDREFKKQNRQA